jgi:type 2 lantibiotic biosynthesis protein LanM
LVGATDDEKVQRWLTHHHLDRQQIVSLLSSPPQRQTGPQPAWIEVLERIMREYTSSSCQERGTSSLDPSLLADDPLPFEEILLPFLRYARHQYRQQAKKYQPLLEDKAQIMLERWLLRTLSRLAGRAFLHEFLLFRERQAHTEVSNERREIYEAFVAQYQDEGLLLFFREYSVLARLLVLQVEQWVDVCTEFLQRLEADRDVIEKTFFGGQSVGQVIEVQPGCSDFHHQGRTVFVVTFAQKLKLVYKPRCLQIDQAFSDLLLWCNAHGLFPPLKPLRVLSRTTYGWAEYITPEPCHTRQEVKTYYQRAGMLLSWLYVLNGSDMHMENLIACGEHPMLIDLETVVSPGFSPCLEYKKRWERSALSDELLTQKRSVIATELLPAWRWYEDINMAADHSGLGGTDAYLQFQPQWCWIHINTDAMSREIINHPGERGLNTVLLQDEVVNALAYGEVVVEGFHRMYRFLIEHRSELLVPDGPLSAFVGSPVRFVRQDTAIYTDALFRLGHPAFLREETERWIELQVFTYPLLEVQDHPFLWKVAESELFALQRLDIPRFVTRFESHDLWLETGETLPDVFPLSALEQVRDGLLRLGEADLLQQCQLIRTAFLLARPTKECEQEQWQPLTAELARHDRLWADDLVEVACQIGLDLKAHAFGNLQTVGTWIGIQYKEATEWFQQGPVGFDLYEGACGIGLFLAALDKVTGQSISRDLIISALRPLCLTLKDAASSLSLSAQEEWKIGGANGLGSWIYALSRIGSWLDLPELLEAAWHATLLLTEQSIYADQSFDVIAGSAGALLGLLSLYEYVYKEEILARAVMCGQHLLEHRVETTSGARSWLFQPQKRPLAGFSHGAAGIAYALLRLAAVTGEQTWKDSAVEAIAFEQSLFSPEAGNWLDVRNVSLDADPRACGTYMTAWCHGAVGIGLARLAGLPTLDTPQVRHDLTVALHTTQHAGLTSVDCLCCGNFGRIELLVAASQRLQQPHLLEVAQQWSSVLIHRARLHGGFRLLPQLPRQARNPGLFQGKAGIGYQLLRVAFPDQVPSVLLWE